MGLLVRTKIHTAREKAPIPGGISARPYFVALTLSHAEEGIGAMEC